MAKVCSDIGCGVGVFSKGLCKKHWLRKYGKKIKVKIKFPTKPRKRINPISKKECQRKKKYRPIRDNYVAENPDCRMNITEGCTKENPRPTVDVHHMKGKIEDLLFDTEFFCPGCRQCHDYAETHPTEAKILGISLNRVKLNNLP